MEKVSCEKTARKAKGKEIKEEEADFRFFFNFYNNRSSQSHGGATSGMRKEKNETPEGSASGSPLGKRVFSDKATIFLTHCNYKGAN